jgi:hypothetical protein
MQNAFQQAVETPLQSSDAMIVGAALSCNGCKGLISIDGDMQVVDSIAVFTTGATNSKFDCFEMLQKLGIREFIIDVIGEVAFNTKFNI